MKTNSKRSVFFRIGLVAMILAMMCSIVACKPAPATEPTIPNTQPTTKPTNPTEPTEPTEPVIDKSIFANNTWAEIADACQKNAVPDTWKVGDTKEMEIDGQSYTVAIIGKNHDTYADGGTAPLTFQVIDLVTTAPMNSDDTNAGGWASSELRAMLQSDAFLNTLPDDVCSNLRTVVKKTNIGGADANGNTVTTVESYDTLFLLANVEVSGDELWQWYIDELVAFIVDTQMSDLPEDAKRDFVAMHAGFCDAVRSEGNQYEYYVAKGDVVTAPTAEEVQTNADLNYWYNMSAATFCDLNGSALYWWFRTPGRNVNMIFDCADVDGSVLNGYIASEALGVSFCFCF